MDLVGGLCSLVPRVPDTRTLIQAHTHGFQTGPLAAALAVTGCSALPPPASNCQVLGGLSNSTTVLVDNANHRLYVYNTTTSKTYSEAQAICAALSFPGVTGKGYLVSWGS